MTMKPAGRVQGGAAAFKVVYIAERSEVSNKAKRLYEDRFVFCEQADGLNGAAERSYSSVLNGSAGYKNAALLPGTHGVLQRTRVNRLPPSSAGYRCAGLASSAVRSHPGWMPVHLMAPGTCTLKISP